MVFSSVVGYLDEGVHCEGGMCKVGVLFIALIIMLSRPVPATYKVHKERRKQTLE
jgi:hypothetical protein